MLYKKIPYKVGDSVRFKDGEKDVDSEIDISGWQGRVTAIEKKHKMVMVALDSITLNNLPREYLEESKAEGMDWTHYNIEIGSVEPAEPRDTEEDVEDAIDELEDSLGWVYLGEEGREMNAILAGAKGEYEQMEAWEKHLRKTLKFPFQAKITEWQKPGSGLQSGQQVRVMSIADVDDFYGVLVKVKKGWKSYIFPLCDLEVEPDNSPNHDPVQLYAVWFANR